MVTPATTVGILGYQGCIEPHEKLLASLGVPTLRVKTPQDLALVDRLIIPGGESTTMLRFIQRYGMENPLKDFSRSKPVWGICAGAILVAREVENPKQFSLNLMDIKAYRNFYGPQTESFTTALSPSNLTKPIEAHFIRAPLLKKLPATAGRPETEQLATSNGEGVFFAQGKCWACSFHAELGSDPSLHQKFLSL
jgi:5'-phosphate synthase pdxT subunit